MGFAETILTLQDKTIETSKPMDIIEFAQSKSGLGLKLYPGQRFILKLFYGLPLLDYIETDDPIIIRDQFNRETLHTFSEREFLDFLYLEKRININYEYYAQRDRPFNEAIFAIGRRGSKTVMSSIITLYTLYLLMRLPDPHDYFRVIPSDNIGIAITSNGDVGAKRQYASISSMVLNSPFFKRYVVSEGSGMILLKTRKAVELENAGRYTEGYQIQITSFPVTPQTRGGSNVCVILDEFHHFIDSNSKQKIKNLDEVMYEALTPSVSGFTTPDGKSFGKKFIISSPNGPKGYMYKLVQEAFTFNKNTLSINTPSHWINLRVSSDEIEDLWNKSETSCRQEFGGEFISGEGDWIKNPNKVWACVDKNKPNMIPAYSQQNGIKYYLGLDLGLSWDGAAFAVAHIEPKRPEQEFIEPSYESLVADGETYIVDYIKLLKPQDNHTGTLDVDEVMDTIENIIRRFNIQLGAYDQWSGELWTQLFEKRGFKQLQRLNATQQSNNDIAMHFKQIIMEGRLILPDEPTFLDELFSLKETVGRNGLIKVENTREHDDMFDAVGRALFLCFQNRFNNNITIVRSSMYGKSRNVYSSNGISVLNRSYTRAGNGSAYNKRAAKLGIQKRR